MQNSHLSFCGSFSNSFCFSSSSTATCSAIARHIRSRHNKKGWTSNFIPKPKPSPNQGEQTVRWTKHTNLYSLRSGVSNSTYLRWWFRANCLAIFSWSNSCSFLSCLSVTNLVVFQAGHRLFFSFFLTVSFSVFSFVLLLVCRTMLLEYFWLACFFLLYFFSHSFSWLSFPCLLPLSRFSAHCAGHFHDPGRVQLWNRCNINQNCYNSEMHLLFH